MEKVHRLFPEHVGRADDVLRPDPRAPENRSALVGAEQAGYILIVDQKKRFEVGEKEEIVIGMEPKIGSYVLPGRPLASMSMDGPITEEATTESPFCAAAGQRCYAGKGAVHSFRGEADVHPGNGSSEGRTGERCNARKRTTSQRARPATGRGERRLPVLRARL